MKQQTAFEWLEKKVFEKAKEMDKEQIMKAYIDSDFTRNISFEQYYNETYGSN